eukprot:810887-Rhodomonas_salina.1
MVEARQTGKKNSAVCPTGLAALVLVLLQAVESDYDKSLLWRLVGAKSVDDVARMQATQVVHDPDLAIFGGAVITVPNADAAQVRPKFDVTAANDFVRKQTCGMINQAFTGELPEDSNFYSMISLVNSFTAKWACTREPLPSHEFNNKGVRGIRFKNVQSAYVDVETFKGAALLMECKGDVFGAYIQPVKYGDPIDLYDALCKVLRGNGKTSTVEVPEFDVESQLNLMNETAGMPLPLLAPGAKLEVFEQQVSVKVDINGAVPGSASRAVHGDVPQEILINSHFFFVVFRVDRGEGVVPMYVACVG